MVVWNSIKFHGGAILVLMGHIIVWPQMLPQRGNFHFFLLWLPLSGQRGPWPTTPNRPLGVTKFYNKQTVFKKASKDTNVVVECITSWLSMMEALKNRGYKKLWDSQSCFSQILLHLCSECNEKMK